MRPQRLRAVALVVVNPAGEILVLQEFVSKPTLGKFAGMFSVPMETCHHGEPDLLALKRLHDEELTGLPFMGKPTRIGAYRVAPQAWAKLYTMSVERVAPIIGQTFEVGNHQWVPVQDALGLWLRRGAPEMIQDYAAGHRNVVRRACIDVPHSELMRA
ncbi:hypothetical protein COU18_01325 [Candidatus Kaiserbacteria bacterium CG10_big_fil_rev_8_21_14_0_10_51_14]|uniref:Uncharacterized protein n=1 Tax=Candidatus Kaiserbacteria bacterium CG10_big_fil_rev_8_21_14_0_10_51_14 TaxID=1974610 RepID=A0A2H0UCA8_9BACT|nr:MAG: hypothetical protein COU18_01325 [Candidatus Kaiserbacteria bacterium CG10_big_fil_rev_8_21_14_0_10_51_14]